MFSEVHNRDVFLGVLEYDEVQRRVCLGKAIHIFCTLEGKGNDVTS